MSLIGFRGLGFRGLGFRVRDRFSYSRTVTYVRTNAVQVWLEATLTIPFSTPRPFPTFFSDTRTTRALKPKR